LRPQPQPSDEISYAPKIGPADAHVRWSVPAHIVDRQIRACTPAPGAWAMFGESRLKIWPVRMPTQPPVAAGRDVGSTGERLRPGELRISRDGVLAGTATHPVELRDVQQSGKRRMSAADWARGQHLAAGAADTPVLT
jgi:methionyl-tRNA formyltransferase